MIQPGELDLGADRWVAFIRTLAMIGHDFTGAAFAMQVRQTPDATGSPLIDLGTVTTASAEGVRLIYAGTATIDEHVADGRLPEIPPVENPATGEAYQGSDSVALSLLGIRINETTIESLPFPSERGEDPEFAWDLHVTPSGSIKDKYVGGAFIVRAGVTQ